MALFFAKKILSATKQKGGKAFLLFLCLNAMFGHKIYIFSRHSGSFCAELPTIVTIIFCSRSKKKLLLLLLGLLLLLVVVVVSIVVETMGHMSQDLTNWCDTETGEDSVFSVVEITAIAILYFNRLH